jgi:hypothetical protein
MITIGGDTANDVLFADEFIDKKCGGPWALINVIS